MITIPEGWHQVPEEEDPQIGDAVFHGGKIVYEVHSIDPEVLLQDEFYPMIQNFGCDHMRRDTNDAETPS